MRAVLQRVRSASVEVDGAVIASIQSGLLILVGSTHDDTPETLEPVANKILNLRIFNDSEGVMNRSLRDVRGEILLVSQFTLYAQCAKGNRPSYVQSAPRQVAEPLYEHLIRLFGRLYDIPIRCGRFGADMQVALVNDGPVTILL